MIRESVYSTIEMYTLKKKIKEIIVCVCVYYYMNEWIEYVKAQHQQHLHFEVKIFHPDFSSSIISHINVGLAFLLFLSLLLRWRFSFVRSNTTMRHLMDHCHNLHLWTAFVIWLFTIQEQGSPLDIGLNFVLFLCNSNLIKSANDKLAKELKDREYKRLIDDAVALYGVNETHCREVVSESLVLRSFLAMIETNLNHNGIHTATERYEKGNELFDDLIKRERLHRQLINSAYINESLMNWLNK